MLRGVDRPLVAAKGDGLDDAPRLPACSTLAHRGIRDAALATAPGERYSLAHLAALRAAAAVLSCRTVLPGKRGRPRSAWVLLSQVAPELSEWAAFFAAGAPKRAAAEAGMRGVVTPREADDLLRDAQCFLTLVETTLQSQLRPV